MKNTFLRLAFLLLLGCPQSEASHRSNTTPADLIIQSRVEKAALSWIVEKTRVLMANANFDDHLSGDIEIDAAPEFVLKDISSDPQYAQLRKIFATVFRTNFDKASIRIRVPSLHYEVKTIEIVPKEVTVKDPHLVLAATAVIKGLTINLPKGVQIDFRIPRAGTQEMDSYVTAFIDPLYITIPAGVPPFSFDAELGVERNTQFHYQLLKYNFDGVPEYVRENQNKIPILAGSAQSVFSSKNIKVNPITVRVNQLKRSFDLDSFKPIVEQKMPDILNFVFTLMGQAIKNTLAPKVLTTVFSHSNRGDLPIENEHIYSYFMSSKFVQPVKDQIALEITGELCTGAGFKKSGALCSTREPRPDPIRKTSEEDNAAALAEVQETLAQGKADVAVTVSEEYLNRVLKTSIDANMWADHLSAHHVALGPKNAFLVLNEKTKTPQLYIDTLYLGEPGLQSVVINGKHPLRFPLRIATSLAFELREGIPTMIMKTESLLSTEDEIIHGIEEFGLESHLLPAFRKKIAHMIIELSSQIEGQTAFELPLPLFKNVGLEKTVYEASEHGRVHLYFKL